MVALVVINGDSHAAMVAICCCREDYYDSSFYFHAGIFQLPVSGVTHMCAGAGQADTPHPPCPPDPGNSTPPPTSKWSGYRLHEKDPLWFEDGVQLLVRNGDVSRTDFLVPGRKWCRVEV